MSYYRGNMTRRRAIFVTLLIATALAYIWVGSHFITWSPDDAQSQATSENTVSESSAPVKSIQQKEEELEAARRQLWDAGMSSDKLIDAYARVSQAETALYGPNWRESSFPPVDATPVSSEETVEDATPAHAEAVGDTPPLPQSGADEPTGQ